MFFNKSEKIKYLPTYPLEKLSVGWQQKKFLRLALFIVIKRQYGLIGKSPKNVEKIKLGGKLGTVGQPETHMFLF